MTRCSHLICAISLILAPFSSYASTSRPKQVAIHGNWHISVFYDRAVKSCAMSNRSEKNTVAKLVIKQDADKTQTDKTLPSDADLNAPKAETTSTIITRKPAQPANDATEFKQLESLDSSQQAQQSETIDAGGVLFDFTEFKKFQQTIEVVQPETPIILLEPIDPATFEPTKSEPYTVDPNTAELDTVELDRLDSAPLDQTASENTNIQTSDAPIIQTPAVEISSAEISNVETSSTETSSAETSSVTATQAQLVTPSTTAIITQTTTASGDPLPVPEPLTSTEEIFEFTDFEGIFDVDDLETGEIFALERDRTLDRFPYETMKSDIPIVVAEEKAPIIAPTDDAPLVIDETVAIEPRNDSGRNISSGAFLLIANWVARKEYFAVSTRANLVLDTSKESWLIFPDNTRFPLRQNQFDAKPNPYHRAAIINQLRKHRYVEIVSYNKKDEEIRYYYDLKDIDIALAALNRYCPLPS